MLAELTLLGTGTSMGVPMIGCHCPVCISTHPRNQRTRSGVFIKGPDGAFLIDTPPELRIQLLREDIDHVDAVCYTHSHADHIMGMDDLRIFGYRRQKAVPLFCEENVERALRQTFSYAFLPVEERNPLHSCPDLEFRRIEVGESVTPPLSIAGLNVQPIRLIHGQLPILGYRVGNVAFCTDCNKIPESSRPLLAGLDVLIIDALWDEPHPAHFSVGQALEVIAEFGPKQAYLTHTSHRLDYDKTNQRLPSGVQMAYDGLRIAVG